MSNKKLAFVIGSIIAAVVLLVVLGVGGVAWFVLHRLGSSEAADTARTHLRSNEILKADVGEVKDFGSMVTGSINTRNGSGYATLNLKVIGERRTVKATLHLYHGSGDAWRVYTAHYERGDEWVDLMPGTPVGIPTHPVDRSQ